MNSFEWFDFIRIDNNCHSHRGSNSSPSGDDRDSLSIITDVGAPLSHAAIVARELGIQSVIGCRNATRLLKTGNRVSVDGSIGKVTILNRPCSILPSRLHAAVHAINHHEHDQSIHPALQTSQSNPLFGKLKPT